MTEILLVCSKNGEIISLEAKGHAGFAEKGRDIVCAAETMLIRTAIQVLEKTEGIKVNTDAASRGSLAFSVETEAGFNQKDRLICTADFLREGLKSLSLEYPDHVQLRETIKH